MCELLQHAGAYLGRWFCRGRGRRRQRVCVGGGGVAYSAAGVPLWTNRYDAAHANDQANAVAVDGSGHVFVTGFSQSSAISGSEDFATIAYSGAGAPLWTNRYNGPGNGNDRASA